MFIPMVIIGNIHLFHDMEGDLKQICLYSGYEYLIAGGELTLERNVFRRPQNSYIRK
jgi:hypothetical protein